MPRIKKTSEDETEPKAVRRTRQSSIVPESPLRRSTRNKPVVRSSTPDLIIESDNIPKRVTRKLISTPDLESSQTTRNLRKRNFRSESEAPATPQVPRITRRTRATSVAAETSKKSAEAPAKRRQRLISIPIEPSLIEEKNDFETSEENSTDDKQNSSHESSEKTDNDQPEETSSTKEEEFEESTAATAEDSVIIVDEVTGVKSVVKKKEKYNAVEKRLLNRILSYKFNFSNNESLNESKINEVLPVDPKQERRASKQLQISNLENDKVSENEDSEEEMEVEEDVFKKKSPRRSNGKKSSLGKKSSEEEVENLEVEEEEVFKEKSPRKSSGKRSSLGKKSSGEEDERLEEEKGKEVLKEKTARKSGGKKSLGSKSFGEENECNGFRNESSSDEKTSPSKKEKTPLKEKTPFKEKTPLKENTSNKGQTPNNIRTPNKSETPKKDPTPSKRFSNESPVAEDTELTEETKDEDSFSEPMEVDISDLIINDSNHESEIETIDVPEKMSRDFKPRKSMIEAGSEKLSFSRERFSLGNKNLDFVEFSTNKEKKSRKSREVHSDSDNFESKSLVNDLPSENKSEHRKSLSSEDRKSLNSEKRKSSSKKRDSCSLSDGPTSFHLLVTPEKDELSMSKEKTSTSSLNKSSEKKSRKRKRESSELDESYQASVLDEEEVFADDKIDMTLTEDNTGEDEETPRKRKSLSKRKSKSNQFAKETESEEKEKRTPKSLQKKKRLSEDLKEEEEATIEKKTPKKDKSLLSKSLEEGEISNSEGENINSEDEEELLKSYQESPDQNQKRRSKSKSFGVTESKMVEKEISKRKSSDNNRSMSSSLEYGTEFEEKEESSLEKSSEKEENVKESESEDNKSNKPVVKKIEILQDNHSFVQILKVNSEERQVSEQTPKKLNSSQTDKKTFKVEENGESESLEEETSDEEEPKATVKRARKSQSIGTTPCSLLMKCKLNNWEDAEESEKKSRFSKKNEKGDLLDVSSRIPAFMFSQTSESEDDNEGSAEEGSKSIDSDIAKEYNLDGETISHYSDDDVPADDCRDSETEHSDSEDEGSDLADFVVDGSEEDEDSEKEGEDVEDENDSDDSVFEHGSKKSPKNSNTEEVSEEEEVDEENEPEESEKESSPSKGQEKQIEEQEIQIHQHEGQIQSQERKIQEMETEIQDRKMQIEEQEKSPEKEQVDLCSESQFENSTNKLKNNSEAKSAKSLAAIGSLVEENKENTRVSKKLKKKEGKMESSAEVTEVSKSEKQKKKKKDLEVEDQELKKRKSAEEFPELEESFLLMETKKKKKSKRKLKKTESKIPVACSTLYEAESDSDEEPQNLSFANARNEVLEANKKKSESIKAGNKLKKNKKKVYSEIEVHSGNIKPLPDELIEDLEDVPRPKKRQKVSNQNDFITPSLGMHDRRYSFGPKSKFLISASDSGSTTEFEVLSLQSKEKKPKAQNSLALKWFKQRMIARNIRLPISVYLSQQQKKKAAGKDHF